MIDVPFNEAVGKIKEASGLSDEEISEKVQEKLEQLNGLISEDGAIHILANELGVKLEKSVPVQGEEVKINNLTLETRGAIVAGRVVQKWDIKEFDRNGRQGRVASLLLGDETGVTRLVFWNDQVDAFEDLKVNDVLRIKNPFVKQSYQKDRVEMQLNDQSLLEVNPEGLEIKAPQRSSDRPERVQKYIKDLEGGEENVEIVATIVQVYDPRFYDACPECRKKLTEGNLCPTHGEVQPDVNFNMSVFLDDGSGNIRTSFWKNQSLNLTGKNEDEFLKYREAPEEFESVKNELLGEIIKVVGSARRNQTFDNLDFTAQLVFKDVDPEKEMGNLDKKIENSKKEVPETEEGVEEAPPVEEDVISLDDLEEMGK